MKILSTLLLFIFINPTLASEDMAIKRLNQLTLIADQLIENDLQGFNKTECQKYSTEALKLGENNFSNETKSVGYFVSGAFEGIIAKGIFSIFNIKNSAKHTKKAFDRLKHSIELDPQNERAVISHARIVKSGYKHQNMVNRYIQPNIDFEQERLDALFNLNNLIDQSNPQIEKYRKKLLELK